MVLPISILTIMVSKIVFIIVYYLYIISSLILEKIEKKIDFFLLKY